MMFISNSRLIYSKMLLCNLHYINTSIININNNTMMKFQNKNQHSSIKKKWIQCFCS